MNHRQVIKGDYVLTPIKNAFNSKTSYWMSKRGYVLAVYCFTPMDSKDLEFHLSPEVWKQYENLFETAVKREITI